MLFIVLPSKSTVQYDEAKTSKEMEGPLKIDNDHVRKEDSKQLISLLRPKKLFFVQIYEKIRCVYS